MFVTLCTFRTTTFLVQIAQSRESLCYICEIDKLDLSSLCLLFSSLYFPGSSHTQMSYTNMPRCFQISEQILFRGRKGCTLINLLSSDVVWRHFFQSHTSPSSSIWLKSSRHLIYSTTVGGISALGSNTVQLLRKEKVSSLMLFYLEIDLMTRLVSRKTMTEYTKLLDMSFGYTV